MARLRKIYIRNQTYFITFRVEAGLPLPPTLLINRILESILCKAQSMYSVQIVCHKFMSNHVHIVITVDQPELVDDFIQYVKRESAHAVNRLLGRRKRTIWCSGYDSPVILDLEKLLEILAYIYANAAESGISDSIENYPGVSSWDMFMSGSYELRHKRLSRSALPVIGTNSLSIKEQQKLINELEKEALEENILILTPYAFLKSFETELTEQELKAEIIQRVRAREAEFRSIRTRQLPSKDSLRTSRINLDYYPKKFGKKMICHSTEKEKRIRYISWFKSLCEKASYIYKLSKNKIAEMRLPPGLFSPGGYLTANIWVCPL